MNVFTKTLFILAIVMGTAITAEAEVFTQTRGQVQAKPEERAVVANMQFAPSNPNVTCLRAKLVYAAAKAALKKAKEQLEKAKESGTGVEAATKAVEAAQIIYDKAFSLLKKVTVAKTETRMALKKYYIIEKQAKEAERRAIIAEEKAALAKRLVTKYEKKEYVVRQCKAKPRDLTPVEKTIVKTLTKRVVKLTHKKVVIEKTIVKLTGQLPTEPADTKPSLVHKINVFKKTLIKITKQITKINKVIENVKQPAPIWVVKRPLVKIE